jgi:acyl-coenzyme A thioesterase PaaI-like protein
MDIQTHRAIDQGLCGTPTDLETGFARVRMTAEACMAADDSGLIHGGFVFGQADYAAMLAVNHPHVVLGGAEVRFLNPVRVGEVLVAEARVTAADGKKRLVTVAVQRDGETVLEGVCTCFVLPRHVLAGPA